MSDVPYHLAGSCPETSLWEVQDNVPGPNRVNELLRRTRETILGELGFPHHLF